MSKWWGTMVVTVGLLGLLPSSANALLVINEVLADPPAITGDANGDGVVSATQDEFVELVNTGSQPVSLAGWTLSDAIAVRHLFSATSVLPANEFFVVFGGGSPQGFIHTAIASTGGLSLNNSGDTVTLRNDHGQVIDALTYGAEGGMDVSLTRVPDGAGSFVKHTTVSAAPFSPGTTVGGQSALMNTGVHTPEPSSLIIMGSGLLVLPRLRRRRR